MKDYEKLTVLLPSGEQNAISAAELGQLLGCDARGVRQQVEAARKDGVLICSGIPGYWLPDSPLEVETTCRRMENAARSALETVARMRGGEWNLEKSY